MEAATIAGANPMTTEPWVTQTTEESWVECERHAQEAGAAKARASAKPAASAAKVTRQRKLFG
jgi:hypothetical protein